MAENSQPKPFSLLWPDGAPAEKEPDLLLPVQTLRDIGLDGLINNLTRTPQERQAFEHVLLHLSDEPQVIAYRQEILADLLAEPDMVAQLRELLPVIESLTAFYFQRGVLYEKTNLYEVTWRLGELESIVTCVHQLKTLLSEEKNRLQAAGWRRLGEHVTTLAADPAFQQMEKELPALLDQVRQTKSVTIGVNLDHNLLPVQATLLGMHETSFSGVGFLDKLFSRQGKEMQGIAQLHDLLANARAAGPLSPLTTVSRQELSPLMTPLFKDLGDVLNRVAKSISRALGAYKRVHGRLFAELWSELVFYLTAVRLVRRMEQCNLPMCRPTVHAKDDRRLTVQGHYNLALSLHLAIGYDQVDLREKVVPHDLALAEDGRIQILTGPNGGGKTTYLQAVGLTQLLAQAGLFIPGDEGAFSPVDNLFTHFPIEEHLEKGTGRFGDEAVRLAEIFRAVTPHSLLLLNESLASTNAGESLYLAKDLVRLLRRVGARAIFATHMHELAAAAPALNGEVDGRSRVLSIVASRIENAATLDDATQRSFQIVPGPPLGHSYARELAAKYGISYMQLEEKLQERGIL